VVWGLVARVTGRGWSAIILPGRDHTKCLLGIHYSKMLDLGITFQPTDPRECAYLCTIPYVKLTCICEVSFIKIFQLIPFVNDIYETNTTISH
jgi:hypothetical protein